MLYDKRQENNCNENAQGHETKEPTDVADQDREGGGGQVPTVSSDQSQAGSCSCRLCGRRRRRWSVNVTVYSGLASITNSGERRLSSGRLSPGTTPSPTITLTCEHRGAVVTAECHRAV